MSGTFIPVVFLLFEILIYLIYRRWRASVDRQVVTWVRSQGIRATLNTCHQELRQVTVLRYSRSRVLAVRVFTMFLLVFFMILAIVAATFPEPAEVESFESDMEFLPCICIAGLAPWLLILEAEGSVRAVTETGIMKRSAWFGMLFAEWGQICRVRWVPLLDNFLVRTSAGSFFISPILENVQVFALEVTERVEGEKWAQAERKLGLMMGGSIQPLQRPRSSRFPLS